MRKIYIFMVTVLVMSLALAACAPTSQQTPPAVTSETGAGGGISTSVPVITATTSAGGEVSTPAAGMTAEVTAEPSLEATSALPSAGTPEAGTATTGTEVATATSGTEVPATAEASTPMPGAEVTGTAVLPATGQAGLMLATQVISQTVTDSKGQPVGQIADFAINLATQHVDYLIVHKNGTVERGQQPYTPVPWSGVTFNSDGSATLAVDQETLNGAPTLDLKSVPILIPSDWEGEFAGYWESLVPAPTSTVTATGTVTATETVSGTQAAPQMEGIVLTRDLIGVGLETKTGAAAGQAVGEVKDLVIDLKTGQVAYILVSGQALGAEKIIPIPLNTLSRDVAKNILTLPLDLKTLEGAPGFDLNSLTSPNRDWETTLKDFWSQLK